MNKAKNRPGQLWSIGIYTGSSLFDLEPTAAVQNPVLTHQEVKDVPASFVADPFMIQVKAKWYLFFEVKNKANRRGEIALATSEDGLHWTYEQIVLAEDFHLSYPYVFEWKGQYYMLPETLAPEKVCLYRATDFPLKWELDSHLIDGMHADPTVFFTQDKWWMFTSPFPHQQSRLNLYFANELQGPWQVHPSSPIIEEDIQRARPAGRVRQWEGKWLRFAQDCYPRYGTQVRIFEIEELSTDHYREREMEQSPLLTASGSGWNDKGMHHIDAHQLADGTWLACVDGHEHC